MGMVNTMVANLNKFIIHRDGPIIAVAYTYAFPFDPSPAPVALVCMVDEHLAHLIQFGLVCGLKSRCLEASIIVQRSSSGTRVLGTCLGRSGREHKIVT